MGHHHTLLSLIWKDRPARIMAVLIALVTVAIVAAAALATGLSSRHEMAQTIQTAIGLSRDRSAAEIVGYGLSFLAAAQFLLAGLSVQSRPMIALSVLAGFIWLDDALKYHEKVGRMLAQGLGLPEIAGLRSQDLGEIIAWSMAAVGLLAILFLCLRTLRPGDAAVLLIAGLILSALVLFGVVFDILHVLASPATTEWVGLIEDGGEMLAIAAFAAFATGLVRIGDTYYARVADSTA